MSFSGQSDAEKQQDSIIKGNQTKINDISTGASEKGQKSFKMFQKSGKDAMDFWRGIVGGDNTQIAELLGPELSTISKTYGNQKNSLNEFSPRGGGTASGNQALQAGEAGQIGDTILKARPKAAEELGSLASLFGSTSQGFTNTSLSGLGEGSQIGFGLNKEQEDIRARQAQMWAALGSAAGKIAAGVMTGGASTAADAASSSVKNTNSSPFGKE